MLNVLLRLLPQSCAKPVLTLLGRVNVAYTEPRAVGVEAHHVHLARNVYRGFEAIGLGDQEISRVSAVARTLYAEPLGIGDTHLYQLVRRRGHAFHPGFAGKP